MTATSVQDTHLPGRIPFLRHIISMVLLFALVLGIVGVNPFRQTLAPMDLMLAYPGWDNAGIDTDLVNAERSDALDHRLPNWREFRRELREGHIPLWNPLHQLGAPGIQAPIYEGLSIPFVVYALTPNEAMGYTFALLSNYLLATFGTYCLLFFMFRNHVAAVFGAITFAFCGFNIAWAHWPHLTTSALVPWVLATQLRYWQTGRLGWAFGFTLSVALTGLGGFPFVAVLGGISSLILGIVVLFAEVRSAGINQLPVRRIFGLGLAGIAGAFLALPGLLQVKEILDSTDLSSRTGGTWFTPYDIVNMFGSDFVNNLGVERTFSAGIPAALLTLLAFYFIFKSPNRFAFFGLFVAVFTLATVFGMAPASIVNAIPGFGFNTWSRGSVLFGLSAAVLSSYSVKFISPSSPNPESSYRFHLVIFICLLQAINLGYWFRQLNARPDIETFFPDTPSISYVASKILPGQSIIADGSFLVSGFLSNYRLPELFAHGFRTDAQNKIAADIAPSFQTTYTASIIQCSDINFSSPGITYAAVRFFLVKEGCTESGYETTGIGQRATASLTNGALQGELVIDKSISATNTQVLFGTYDRDFAPSAVMFDLYRDKLLVAHAELTPEAIRNNQYATFNFNQDVPLVAGTYRYVISMAKPDSQKMLSAWAFDTAGGATYQIGSSVFPGIPKMRIGERARLPQNLSIASAERGISVIENHTVSGSGYYVNGLSGQPEADFGPVRLATYRPDDLTVEYSDATHGWVVFPIRANKYWRATLDGKPVELGKFLDFFPAVEVNGPSKIRFYYDSSHLLKTLELCTAGFAASVILLIMVNGRASRPRAGAG
ncbi:YfhO family protein [Mesorhizobium sp. B2-4-19]|uniref:YfhO family protein n=1 Tax=Mesorhizobium sp. B2-4-19 TaxID=2589930 RepID=UPI001126A747|nr:YfhO family protein [Mesorhizobium sp. B2-4-19]TPK69224.1 YfhO family protein [Mesorhizobium sp. B2-4-19]